MNSLLGPAAAIALGLGGLGATLSAGRAVASALEGTARNPAAAATIRGTMILGLALIESITILMTVLLKM